MAITVRRAEAADVDFLAAMLADAAFWRPDGPSGSVAEVLAQPNLAHYVVAWPRPGDLGVVALDGRRRVGAAWVRLLPESDPGYGFARDLYERVGFRQVAEVGASLTMLLRLQPPD